jgi:glutathione S-transferase
MILYNYDLDDACYTVRLTAACLGLTPDIRNIDMFPGREQLSPAMLAISPVGRLPVLEDGGLVLAQLPAILLHLSDSAGAALQPAGADRARMQEWLAFAARDLAVASQARAVSLMGLPGDFAALQRAARDALRIMDDAMTRLMLGGTGFFAGPALSLADLALFPAFALSRDYGIDHDSFPALRLWARRVRATQGFITMPGIPDYH